MKFGMRENVKMRGGILTHMSKKEPSEQRADSGECDCAFGEVSRLEGGSRERPNAGPYSDFADIAICA